MENRVLALNIFTCATMSVSIFVPFCTSDKRIKGLRHYTNMCMMQYLATTCTCKEKTSQFHAHIAADYHFDVLAQNSVSLVRPTSLSRSLTNSLAQFHSGFRTPAISQANAPDHGSTLMQILQPCHYRKINH